MSNKKNKISYRIDLILIVVIICFIIGIVANFIPTSYKVILIQYKFERNGTYYVLGETTSSDNSNNIDLYIVDKSEYDKFLEGFEYLISTTGVNKWSNMLKKINEYRPMVYD